MVEVADCQTEPKQKIQKYLGNRFWRLNNLYWILNEQGIKVRYRLNVVQYALYLSLWWLNIILKSRQHGITTFIAIYFLDYCLFNSNTRAGIIAHKLEDGKKIFRDKIKYAYNNMPEGIKQARKLIKDDACEILFDNNSSVYVSTSMRSGTLQLLHVSEYGWICAHAPQKAAEIKAGALETIHDGGQIFIESTAEGPIGDFAEMCNDAQALRGKELGKMDYKFHFYAWHDKPENQTDPAYVNITDEMNRYFEGIEKIYDKIISLPQRAWYVMKKKTLKYLIYKEHPSTPEEAFQSSVEGAYYIEEISTMRESGRITRVPYLPSYAVHTVCDIGLGSGMPWIFYQRVGIEIHIIDSFCMDGKDTPYFGIDYYKRMLNEYQTKKGYIYGKHFCPFDVNKGELGTGRALYETAKQIGLQFTVLEREDSVLDGIGRTQNMFPRLWIDADNKKLIEALTAYHREWVDNLGVYTELPVHDKSSHYADAVRYMSMAVEKGVDSYDEGKATNKNIAELNNLYLRPVNV